jgi:hypothetical protein
MSVAISNCSPKGKDNKTRDFGILAFLSSLSTEYVGPGKLVFTEGNSTVKVFNLESNKLEKTYSFTDKGLAIRIYSGGSGLFTAVVLGSGQANSEVQYIDMGMKSPALKLSELISGKTLGANFGGHYRADLFHHLNFFDVDGKTTISTEASLKNGIVNEITNIGNPHHGVSIGFDKNHVLISKTHPGLTYPVSGNTVAFGVSLWKVEGSSLIKIQDSLDCNNMHGEANNAEYTAYGCRLSGIASDPVRTRDEGILVIKKNGNGIESKKVKYPLGSEDNRVTSNIWSHKNQSKMIGNFNIGANRKILLFDPADVNSAQQIDVADYSSVVYEWAKGNEILLLHANGKLGVYSAKDMSKIRDLETGLVSNSGIQMTSGIGRVYLTVSSQGKILEVPIDGSPLRTIDVGGTPSGIVYSNTIASGRILGKNILGGNSGEVTGWSDTYDDWSDKNE